MTIVFYRDTQGAFRWRVKASNGRVLADSAEGYRRKVDCRRIADKLFGFDSGADSLGPMRVEEGW